MKVSKFDYSSLTKDKLIMLYSAKNANFKLDKEFVNILIIRDNDPVGGTFNDIEIVWSYNPMIGLLLVNAYQVTCDPSDIALTNPKNPNGTAILPNAYHHELWTRGKHKGYDALVQANKTFVIRDNDKNNILNFNIPTTFNSLSSITRNGVKAHTEISKYFAIKPNSPYHATYSIIKENFLNIYKGDKLIGTLEYGLFGINNHRASQWKVLERVGLYSEGCVVHQNPYKYKEFLKLCYDSKNYYFSPLIINQSEYESFILGNNNS